MLPRRRPRTWGRPGTPASRTPRATDLTAPYLAATLGAARRRSPARSVHLRGPRGQLATRARGAPARTPLSRAWRGAQCACAELRHGDCASRSYATAGEGRRGVEEWAGRRGRDGTGLVSLPMTFRGASGTAGRDWPIRRYRHRGARERGRPGGYPTRQPRINGRDLGVARCCSLSLARGHLGRFSGSVFLVLPAVGHGKGPPRLPAAPPPARLRGCAGLRPEPGVGPGSRLGAGLGPGRSSGAGVQAGVGGTRVAID